MGRTWTLNLRRALLAGACLVSGGAAFACIDADYHFLLASFLVWFPGPLVFAVLSSPWMVLALWCRRRTGQGQLFAAVGLCLFGAGVLVPTLWFVAKMGADDHPAVVAACLALGVASMAAGLVVLGPPARRGAAGE